MGNLCNRHNLRPLLRVLYTKCLVKSELSDAEFLIELGHHLLKIPRRFCFGKMNCQCTNPVSDSAVVDMPFLFGPFVIKKKLVCCRTKVPSKLLYIVVEQLFHNCEIMERYLIDTALDHATDLTGRTVGILIIHQQKGQVCVPEIPLQAMLFRKFQNPVDTFKKQCP